MKQKAIAAYRRAIELAEQQLAVNPKRSRLRANMAIHCAKTGDLDKALAMITLATEQKPDDGAILFDLAVIYEIAGRREDALRALEMTIRCGAHYHKEIKKDPELAALRKTERYRRLLSP